MGFPPHGPSSPEPIERPPAEPAAPEREPAWGYRDVFYFLLYCAGALGMALVVALVAAELIELIVGASLFAEDSPGRIYVVLGIQALWWLLILGGLFGIVSIKYGRPFWRSLGWRWTEEPPWGFATAGVVMAFAVAGATHLLPMPEEELPIERLLENRASLIALAAFGVLIAPALEELVFRGFLFPVIERSHGPVAAVLATSALFAVLHAQQYGGHWQILSLLFLVGCALGTVRARTGVTATSTLMHAAYNATLFAGLFAAGDAGLRTG